MIALAGAAGRIASLARALPGWVWGALVAGVALLLWGNHREASGRTAERTRWEHRLAAAEAHAAALRAQRAQAAAAALAAGAERDRLYALARAPLTNKVIRYVATPAAAVPCPDPDGLRLGQAAIDAANAATAAAR